MKVVAGILLALILTACGGSEGYVDEPKNKNTDPRMGTVQIGDENIYKRCDGTTLIYFGNNQQIVTNSPECSG